MASEKITGLTELAVAPANTDFLEIVDVSDTTMAPTGTNKKIQVSNLFANAPTGSGTTNTIPLWTGTNTLGNSNFTQSGTSLIPTAAGNLGSSSNKFTSLHVSTSIIGSTIDLDFVVNGSNRMRIKADGSIVVNDSVALAQFHVKSSIGGFSGAIYRGYSSANILQFDVRDNGNTGIGGTALSGEMLTVAGVASTSQYIASFYSGGQIGMVVRGHGSLGGSVGVGRNTGTDVRFHVKGFGTTSATTTAIFENSVGSEILTLIDDRSIIANTNMSIGSGVVASSSSILELSSTTKGFLPPRMTTAQKNAISSPAAGLVVYDTTLNKLCVYTTAWETITSV